MADSPPNDLETGIGIWAPKFVPVVFFLLLLALAGSGTLLGADAVRFARERMEQRANALFAAWKQRSASHMAHILQSIAADERYRRPFLTRDGDSLRTRLQPLFDLLERSHHYTQLALYDTNGGPVWHRHSPPPGEGARIPATLLEAHRRNQTATGLQTDHRGVLSLSVVVPWQGAGERIGYLELIREIDPVRDRLEMAPGFHLYPFIDKNRLRRPLWEKRLARSKQPARWDEWSDLAATTSGPEATARRSGPCFPNPGKTVSTGWIHFLPMVARSDFPCRSGMPPDNGSA